MQYQTFLSFLYSKNCDKKLYHLYYTYLQSWSFTIQYHKHSTSIKTGVFRAKLRSQTQNFSGDITLALCWHNKSYLETQSSM